MHTIYNIVPYRTTYNPGRLRMSTMAERNDLKQRLDALQTQLLQASAGTFRPVYTRLIIPPNI